MPKTIRNKFNDKLTFNNLLKAFYIAKKNKANRKDVIRYEMDLETNIVSLLKRIKNNTYKLGKYRLFTIYEPKKRIIKSLPFEDRIVHQFVVNEFIKPYYLNRFIKDTYACIEDRGTHKSVYQLKKYMTNKKKENSDYYILKCDIKKYFFSINKRILFNILSKSIKDKKLLNLLSIIIFDEDNDISIPIGSLTSQWFANIYLNELDKYIKHILNIKYYIRYMDDFILLLDNKEESKIIKKIIEIFLKDKLELELNNKSKYYHSKYGCNFCGYIIYEDYMLLRKRSKLKIYKDIRLWNKLYILNKLDINKMIRSYNSWYSHSIKANSFNFRRKVYNRIIPNIYIY